MTSSDNVQIPIEHLHSIANLLSSTRDDLDSSESELSELAGHDDVHGFKIQTAVDDFFSEWKTSRRTLIENVGGLGTIATEIADQTATFDDQLAGTLSEFAAKLSPQNG